MMRLTLWYQESLIEKLTRYVFLSSEVIEMPPPSSSGSGTGTGKGNPPRGLQKKKRVRTARGRKNSSTRWLQRQLNDPYVAEAQRQGYRSRAAFKIIQLDEMFGLFKKGRRIVDLGAAPGGWTQVAIEKVKPRETGGIVVAIDYLEMEGIEGATVLQKDFTEDDAPDMLKQALGGGADVVLSDMAPPTTGHRATDHLRITALAEMAYEFAREVLEPGGFFVTKLFQGGAEKTLLDALKRDFEKVKHVKPNASRKDSSEMYIVGQGFRG